MFALFQTKAFISFLPLFLGENQIGTPLGWILSLSLFLCVGVSSNHHASGHSSGLIPSARFGGGFYSSLWSPMEPPAPRLCPPASVSLELHACRHPSATFSLCPCSVLLSSLAPSASLSGPLCLNHREGQGRPPPTRLIIHLQTVLQRPCTCSWAPSRPAGAAQPIEKLLQRERHRPGLQLLPRLPETGTKSFSFPPPPCGRC